MQTCFVWIANCRYDLAGCSKQSIKWLQINAVSNYYEIVREKRVSGSKVSSICLSILVEITVNYLLKLALISNITPPLQRRLFLSKESETCTRE